MDLFFYIVIIIGFSLLYHGYVEKKKYEFKAKEIELEAKKVELETKKLENSKSGNEE